MRSNFYLLRSMKTQLQLCIALTEWIYLLLSETAFWRENGRFHGRITWEWAIRPKYCCAWHHAAYV